MDKEEQVDPGLSAPQESNTTKHINFLEAEENAANSTSSDNDDAIDNPARKEWEEMREEKSKQQNQEEA
jgi:hypothetical protein